VPALSPRLSPRQRELLCLLAEGYHLYAAADVMCISRHTARNTVAMIRARLQAATTTHAVCIAIEARLIPASKDGSLVP